MASVLSVARGAFRSASGNARLLVKTAGGREEAFVCQFNPEDFQIQTSGKFSEVERVGKDSPIVQFICGSTSNLQLKLFFDTSSKYEIKPGALAVKPKREKASDVSVYTNELMSMVRVDGKVHHPPIVTFSWGSLVFSGFVRSVGVHYVMFEKGGMPVRAEVTLDMMAMDLSVTTEQLSPMESPDRTKCIVMTSDSSLWDIAEREYGDASHWREIARANDMINPLEVEAGTRLKVPALK